MQIPLAITPHSETSPELHHKRKRSNFDPPVLNPHGQKRPKHVHSDSINTYEISIMVAVRRYIDHFIEYVIHQSRSTISSGDSRNSHEDEVNDESEKTNNTSHPSKSSPRSSARTSLSHKSLPSALPTVKSPTRRSSTQKNCVKKPVSNDENNKAAMQAYTRYIPKISSPLSPYYIKPSTPRVPLLNSVLNTKLKVYHLSKYPWAKGLSTNVFFDKNSIQ